MSSTPQQYLDALTAELKRSLPGQLVEVREPAEGELKANKEARQIFITTEGIDIPQEQQIADLGLSSVVLVPVQVATVMPRPATIPFAVQTLRRRLQVLQAVQRCNRQFCETNTGCLLDIVGETPALIEGFYVSVVTVNLTLDLQSEENL